MTAEHDFAIRINVLTRTLPSRHGGTTQLSPGRSEAES